jgi:hypothetical protein
MELPFDSLNIGVLIVFWSGVEVWALIIVLILLLSFLLDLLLDEDVSVFPIFWIESDSLKELFDLLKVTL